MEVHHGRRSAVQRAIFQAGNIAGRGSAVLSVPQAGLDGYDLMTAPASEATAAVNTPLTDGSADITIARYALRREISDLANMTDSVGLNVERLAADRSATRSTDSRRLSAPPAAT
jgi:hypothetical protein